MSTERVAMQLLEQRDGQVMVTGLRHYQRRQYHASDEVTAACPDMRSMCGHIRRDKDPCFRLWATNQPATCSTCLSGERNHPEDVLQAEPGWSQRVGEPPLVVVREVDEKKREAAVQRALKVRQLTGERDELLGALQHAELRIAELMEREDLWTKWFKETINNAPEPR